MSGYGLLPKWWHSWLHTSYWGFMGLIWWKYMIKENPLTLKHWKNGIWTAKYNLIDLFYEKLIMSHRWPLTRASCYRTTLNGELSRPPVVVYVLQTYSTTVTWYLECLCSTGIRRLRDLHLLRVIINCCSLTMVWRFSS